MYNIRVLGNRTEVIDRGGKVFYLGSSWGASLYVAHAVMGKKLRTTAGFLWTRSYSPMDIEIPKGAPVEYSVKNRAFYIPVSFFVEHVGGIAAHDACYYGCRVEPFLVETFSE